MLSIWKDSKVFTYAVIVALFLLFLLIYFPTLSVLHVNWSEMHRAYAHGYMILVIAIYLLYISRENIFLLNQRDRGQFFWISLLAIFISSLVWFLAFSVQIQVIQLFAVILMIWLWIAVVFGKSASIHAFMPMFLLLMALPLWEVFIFYLQELTVFATSVCLSWFGVLAFIDGYYIHLVDGVIEVAEECSGLKYLLAGVSLGIIYAELNINTIQRKIGIIFLAGILSIIANWIRVITLVLIADVSKMQSSMLYKHDNLGWVVFALCFAVFFVVAARIDSGRNNDGDHDQPQISKNSATRLIDSYYFRAFSATLIVSILPVFGWVMTEGVIADKQIHLLQFEAAKKIYKPAWIPDYIGYDDLNTWRVILDAREVDITILSYRSQKQGKELIYYKNKLYEPQSKVKDLDSIVISNDLSINRSVLSLQSGNILVGWLYKIGDFESNNANIAKLLQIPSVMQGVSVASLVAISMECASDDCKKEKDIFSSRELIEAIMGAIVVRKQIENKS